MIQQIISGGQTGADQAGLYAAEELGIKTGGCIPYGARTDDGPNWEIVSRFGLIVHASATYPPRTEVNVVGSDGTVWFGNIYSPGGRLTHSLCLKHHKPWIANPTEEGFKFWLSEHKIEIMNVAGNRERTNRGIFERTKRFLISALTVR